MEYILTNFFINPQNIQKMRNFQKTEELKNANQKNGEFFTDVDNDEKLSLVYTGSKQDPKILLNKILESILSIYRHTISLRNS